MLSCHGVADRSWGLEQKQHQRGPKVYSLHALEAECIGGGRAHRPYEFGVTVSVAATLLHARGAQFATHVGAARQFL